MNNIAAAKELLIYVSSHKQDFAAEHSLVCLLKTLGEMEEHPTSSTPIICF
jgi:hypothetical protein